MNYKMIKGGITAPKGFQATGTAAGIKYKDRKDMALVYSEQPCIAAATFTTNVVKAAPVKWDREIVEHSPFLQAIVVNAGIANACTNEQGMQVCKTTAETAGKLLNIPANAVAVSSTGVIGMQVPVDKIVAGVEKMVPQLGTSIEDGLMAAQSIMTTDTISKEEAVTFEIGGKTVTMGAMCKGSGMIHPNMCTLLAYVTTDLAISKELLAKALREDVQDTFNMISVDGDTSTNDTLLILANGMAGNPEITEEGADYEIFKEALHYINETQAKKMAGDGEGATALIEAKVIHADTKENAKLLAKSVICSSLTKAAIYGHDSNWGRIMCAMGYSGAAFDPEKVDLYYEGNGNKMLVCHGGAMADYSEEEATRTLSASEVTLLLDMNAGEAFATAWGCDLTYDYVKINADYRS